MHLQSLNSDQQTSVVTDVRQAMRHAANELEGKEKILPGFCLRKVSTCGFPRKEEGMRRVDNGRIISIVICVFLNRVFRR